MLASQDPLKVGCLNVAPSTNQRINIYFQSESQPVSLEVLILEKGREGDIGTVHPSRDFIDLRDISSSRSRLIVISFLCCDILLFF